MLQLMKHVRLPLISREFLMTHVDTEVLVRENAECKELLLEGTEKILTNLPIYIQTLLFYIASHFLPRFNRYGVCLAIYLNFIAMRYHLLPEQRSSLSTQRTTTRKPDGMKPYVFAIGK